MRTLNLVVLFFGLSVPAMADRGIVSHKQSGCDYFVVETNSGYDVFEWYGGYDPDKGDVLVGKFSSYGMRDVYDETMDQNIKIWVEDYDLSKEDALEKLVDHCE
jgi:hypothetical protein